MKCCTVCKIEKSESEFHKAGRGLQGACKPCVVLRVDTWRDNNPGVRSREYQKAKIRGKTRTQVMSAEQRSAFNRKHDLKRKYGVTVEWYEATLQSQGGACAICLTPPRDSKKRRLAVDHNHDTDTVRGLLCAQCNAALERMESIPEWHEKAMAYLVKYEIAAREKEFK